MKYALATSQGRSEFQVQFPFVFPYAYIPKSKIDILTSSTYYGVTSTHLTERLLIMLGIMIELSLRS